jgi:thiol:disulfide interchange protein DsbC
MNPLLRSTLVLALTATLSHAGFAQEAVIRENLAKRLPDMPKIDEVTKTPIPGVYEVRMGTEIIYTDERGDHVIEGNLIETKTRTNLTEARIDKLTAIDFAALPLKDAIVWKQGTGARKLVVFADPNCGYCKQFERDLTKIDNVTIQLFLYPVLGPDSVVKSRNIWCAKDKAKSWDDWMQRGVAPAAAECDTTALTRNREFGQKYNITGTPTLIFSDGTRAPGAIPAAQVEKQLAALD